MGGCCYPSVTVGPSFEISRSTLFSGFGDLSQSAVNMKIFSSQCSSPPTVSFCVLAAQRGLRVVDQLHSSQVRLVVIATPCPTVTLLYLSLYRYCDPRVFPFS